MTNKEAFEAYSGLYIPLKAINAYTSLFPDGNARLIGYYNDDTNSILVERKGGNGLQGYSDYTILNDLPPTTQVWAIDLGEFDWSRVEVRSAGPHQCCRCGMEYDNKREHRKVCR